MGLARWGKNLYVPSPRRRTKSLHALLQRGIGMDSTPRSSTSEEGRIVKDRDSGDNRMCRTLGELSGLGGDIDTSGFGDSAQRCPATPMAKTNAVFTKSLRHTT